MRSSLNVLMEELIEYGLVDLFVKKLLDDDLIIKSTQFYVGKIYKPENVYVCWSSFKDEFFERFVENEHYNDVIFDLTLKYSSTINSKINFLLASLIPSASGVSTAITNPYVVDLLKKHDYHHTYNPSIIKTSRFTIQRYLEAHLFFVDDQELFYDSLTAIKLGENTTTLRDYNALFLQVREMMKRYNVVWDGINNPTIEV